jgi:hypothetical protein
MARRDHRVVIQAARWANRPGSALRCAHFAVGRYDRAARWVQSGTKAFPGAFWADRIAVAAAVHTGAKAEARRIARRLMRKDPGLTTAKARRSWPFPLAFMERVGDGLAAAGVPQG